MTAETTETIPDYRATLHLPRTEFPMRAGLPAKEPEILARWARLGMYARLRQAAKGQEKYILHDGPPYANGHIHIGTALNKILKDVVTRSMQMLGYDSNYVPGWDCHGLPIEWKIEEEYRARGKNKDHVPLIEFRKECREFAEHWIEVQREEFKRLGVEGDWDDPYTTMSFAAEAQIARELMKFATSGQLYRGSKPVMWSVVEKTALAEAEVEYHDYESDQVWVKFPCRMVVRRGATIRGGDLEWNEFGKRAPVGDEVQPTSLLIWTTTPWTLPGNRALSYSPKISYGLYRVTNAPEGNWAKVGATYILADNLAKDVSKAARAETERIGNVSTKALAVGECEHPLAGIDSRYGFTVPLLPGEHVTEDTGTGFVHTAPGHGAEDFEVWIDNKAELEARGIDTAIPYTVDENGAFTKDAPGFTGKRVITDSGEEGDANEAVVKALIDAGMLIARGRLTHQYPHSWRSKKPVIFRNTPQWFIAMDKPIAEISSPSPLPGGERSRAERAGEGEGESMAGSGPPHPVQAAPGSTSPPGGEVELSGDTLRARALKAISETRFVPGAGRNRIGGMIENRPDWVVSRQRAWGVPITVFVDRETGELLNDAKVNARIIEAFEAEGADAWFAEGAKARFLGDGHDPDGWEQVTDILDVWFDSGSTHAFVLETRDDLKWPASLYLEGSDQHRGWFHSSLLEACGTRGRAPYEAVLTHGFVVDEDGRKMSKSLGNQVQPQEVVEKFGADILRLWVMSSDYAEDLRIGPEIVKSNADAYRRLRNTIRFMLGNLSGFSEKERLPAAEMPELERWVLHRLWELDRRVCRGYRDFAFQRIFSALFNFCTVDLSAVYFDIRKDALYCDPMASTRRRACRSVLDHLFGCIVTWLAPMLCFTTEEAWLTRFPGERESVHLKLFPEVPEEWRDDALAEKFAKVRTVRRVVTGALELERAEKRIGASLEAAPILYLSDPDLLSALDGLDMAEICITSGFEIRPFEAAPADAFRLAEASEKAAVTIAKARGEKCARCWMILPDVGSHEEAPGTCERCAEAVAASQS